MSSLLQLVNISYGYTQTVLFENLNLVINTGDKIALVGHNGCGKSTLVQLIAGQLQADQGELRMPRGQRLGFVEQFMPEAYRSLSLLETCMSVFDENLRNEKQHLAEQQLQAVGFEAEQNSILIKDLSGGQQNLVLLVRALLIDPDLLIMDEPGNHMDIWVMQRFCDFLQQIQLPFLMIAHDRHLLNTACNKTVFLRDQQAYSFSLSFDSALQALQDKDEADAAKRSSEQKKIDQLAVSQKRMALWGKIHNNEKFARRAKSMDKRLDRLKTEQTEVTKGSGLHLSLQTQNLRAKQVLCLDNVKILTPDRQRHLLTVQELVIRPGDRVVLLGVNGVGKSSLLEAIRQSYGGSSQDADSIRFNPRASMQFYDQELSAFSQNIGRLHWLRKNTQASEHVLKKNMLNIGIPYIDFDQPLNQLSGGEKARMMFLKMAINRPSFMILDEPTNHIDLQAKEELLQQLMESDATLLITSHDKYFIEQIATRWFWIKDGGITEIQDSDLFYQSLNLTARQFASDQGSYCSGPSTESNLLEDVLPRIELVEKLLQMDLARKPKHQKIERQQQWRKELESLWALIDAEG